MTHITLLTAALLAAASTGGAQAASTVLTFDDIAWLADGYGDITGWEGLGSLRFDDPPGNTLFHGGIGGLEFSAPVRLSGLEFLSWTAEGLGGFQLYFQGVEIFEYRDLTNGASPVWVDLSMTGPVDRIAFFGSSDGFLLDNLTYSFQTPVPEAQTSTLLAAGLGLIGFMTWRRRRHQVPC